MKKIPYGISNFETIQTENYYFVDKSTYIQVLEETGSRYLFFLRPRRFGKSLFISMLEHYYDISRKEQFNELFADTYIGKNPTPLRNAYPVLKFNFSMVSTDGGIDEIKHSFLLNIKSETIAFMHKYKEAYDLDLSIIENIERQNKPEDILMVLNTELKIKKVSLYLIIDEYDNFGNNVLIQHGEQTYMDITHGAGFLRSFFAIIKGLTDSREIERLFITGVSPMVMADVTSGFNIGDNVSLRPDLAAMAGFTQNEIREMVNYYLPDKFDEYSTILSEWYNNYCFDENLSNPDIYNSVSILSFIKEHLALQRIPTNLIDENLRTDYGKLRFLIIQHRKLNGNFSVLTELVENGETTGKLIRSFALNELIGTDKFRSLLYYLGLTTLKAVSITGRFTFTPPNKLINTLLWEYVQKSLNEVYRLNMDIDFIENSFDKMARTGEWKPVFQYIIEKFYEAVSLRDFTFHEEGLKTFMLAWFNLTNLYDVISEKESNKGYADIALSPDRRFTEYIKYDFFIELKYLKSKDIETPEKETIALKQALEEATLQLSQYAAKIQFKTIKIVVIVSSKKLVYMERVE